MLGLPNLGLNSVQVPLEARIASLFANGEEGAWYDPSDLSTLYQDSAGTTPVTALGQPVGLMLDKSGRGNHASQPTATARPTLQADASGRKYLQFDGVDDFLSTAAIDFTGTDKMTAVAGVRKDTEIVAIIAELSANVFTNNGSFYLSCNDTGDTYRANARGTISTSAAFVDFSGAAVLSSTHDIANDLSTIRVNGVAGIDATDDKGGGNFGNYPLYIGRRGGISLPFKGNLYPLLIRGALSSAAQIAAAERYAANKTGVTL